MGQFSPAMTSHALPAGVAVLTFASWLQAPFASWNVKLIRPRQRREIVSPSRLSHCTQ